MDEFHMYPKVDDPLFPLKNPRPLLPTFPTYPSDSVCGAPPTSPKLGFSHTLGPNGPPFMAVLSLREV